MKPVSRHSGLLAALVFEWCIVQPFVVSNHQQRTINWLHRTTTTRLPHHVMDPSQLQALCNQPCWPNLLFFSVGIAVSLWQCAALVMVFGQYLGNLPLWSVEVYFSKCMHILIRIFSKKLPRASLLWICWFCIGLILPKHINHFV